jgi:hypothetical protein
VKRNMFIVHIVMKVSLTIATLFSKELSKGRVEAVYINVIRLNKAVEINCRIETF